MERSFRAFVVERAEGQFSLGVKELNWSDLPDGEVTIRVLYSGVNYKDGLAASPHGKVVRKYPMVPGIDLAGSVAMSSDARFQEGDEVIVTSYELGIAHFGGYSEYARVPAAWAVKRPAGLTLQEAMLLGTAGFTAALSLQRLEENGLRPEHGPVLVTGATGGVGSNAVAMLHGRGYAVAAVTGKSAEHAYLQQLGAQEVLAREVLSGQGDKPLRQERWAAAVDPVGGAQLPFVLSTIRYGGSVALSGLAGGAEYAATVYPFILRGVNLLGIDSVYCPMHIRQQLWERMASDLKPAGLAAMLYKEVTLEELPEALESILTGSVRGRVLVRL
jgi:acrylyl-CoA reductase (NADPH)